jgi:hypothetical protein
MRCYALTYAACPLSAAPIREPLYAGQFEIPIAARSTPEGRKPRSIRELEKEKKAVMCAAEFDHEAFGLVQDELDYAYSLKSDKEKKRVARAKTKGIKALYIFIAQALVNKKPP